MTTKKNFLGGQQNYNAKTGEYEPALVGKNGKVVKDADGDGKVNEGGKQPYSKELEKHNKIINSINNNYSKMSKEEYWEKIDEEVDRFNGVQEKYSREEINGEQDFNDPKEAKQGVERDFDNSWEKDFSPEEVKKMKNEYPGKEEHIKKLKDAGFSVDEGYKAGNTFKIDGKDFGDKASISIGENGKYFRVTKNGGSYTYKDLDTAIDRAKYTSGKAPSEDAVGWETGSYDAKTEQDFLEGGFNKQEVPKYEEGKPGVDYDFYDDGTYTMRSRKTAHSSFEEPSVAYDDLGRFYGIDIEKLVYGKGGYEEVRDDDFHGDIIYSESAWDKFENWVKEKYGVDLEQIRKDKFEEYKKSHTPME